MALPRSELRWNGWGRIDARDPLGPQRDAAFGWLMNMMNVDALHDTPAATLSETVIPTAALPQSILVELSGIVGADHVMTDHETRARFARGQSYHDLLWL